MLIGLLGNIKEMAGKNFSIPWTFWGYISFKT